MKFLFLLFVLPFVMLQSCSGLSDPTATSSNKVQVKQALETNHTSTNVTVMQSEDNTNVKFDVTGTITKINIEDVSKKAGIQNLYTRLTVKVETTSPPDVASKLTVDELSLSRKTIADIDKEISVGDKVTITVIGNNFSEPSWFRIYDMKKVVN
jgi:hypothetical protein